MGGPLDERTYETVKRLYLEARQLAPDQRGSFLDERCAGRAELRSEVQELLAQELDEFLARPATQVLPDPGPGESLSQPERIGAYRILKPLGFGGMGVVYLAEQDSPKRAVALKLLRLDSASPRQLERFELEAELLGRLSHPGIARVYEAGWTDTETGRRPFFAMEYVEGRSLVEFASEHRLPPERRIELVCKVAEAAHFAHERGVVHRDLKPSNVVVDARGEPRVLDFGVARPLGSSSHATQTGQLVGTLNYMSPEQASGQSTVDARADVYSLGVMLYELLTARLPIPTDGAPLHEAVRRIREDDPISAGAVRRELGGDLDTILSKALAKEVALRYASAAELAEDLRRFLEHRPIHARRPTSLYVAWKLVRRHRMLAASVLALFLAVIVTQYFAMSLLERNRELERADAQRRFYSELGQDLGELNRVQDLDQRAELLKGLAAAEPLLAEWVEEARGMVARQEERRSRLEELRGDGLARLPGTEDENRRFVDMKVEIVNRVERLVGPRGHLPEMEARLERLRRAGPREEERDP
jgi:serine/threonine protein kinase